MISDNYVVTNSNKLQMVGRGGGVIDAAEMGGTISGGGLNVLYFIYSVNKKLVLSS